MVKLKIAVLPGDGIGPEVTLEALRILRAVDEVTRFDLRVQECYIGGAAVKKFGTPLPTETLDACLKSDAVLLGAVGGPEFDKLPPEQRPETGLLKLRQALGGFANLRPVTSHAAIADCSALRADLAVNADVLIVRELLGGIYFGEPRGFTNDEHTAAVDTMRYSEREIERVARVAFDVARKRRRKVTSVDKANVLHTSRLWRSTVERVARDYPEIKLQHMYVDACAMQLISAPTSFDVILTENMFGDILSDEAAATVGSLGMLPSATLGGEVDLYEPVHGSAPDIAGKGIANPLGAIGAAALLLRHTAGLESEALAIELAIRRVLEAGYRTADLNRGTGRQLVTTNEMGGLVERAFIDAAETRHAYHAV